MKVKQLSVKLEGLSPIMFARYAGDNKTQLPPEEKLYKNDKGQLVFPALNLMAFLSNQNATCAARAIGGKRWKAIAQACLSYVSISPVDVPFTAKGKPIMADDKSKIEVLFHVARMKKGALVIPNPVHRPVLHDPWELAFTVSLLQNPEVDAHMLKEMFTVGGMAVALGTFRPVYGKFSVAEFKEISA